MAGGCLLLLLLGPAVQPAKFWASTSRKSRPPAPRLPLGERWVISLRLAGRSGNTNKLLLICRCFTLAVMLTKYPFQPPSAPCLSVCRSVCVSVSLFRGLFLSVSLPPKLVSQLLLTPRDKAVPVVTSADTTQGTHARAFACVRLAHAPLTYLLGGRWR